MARTFSFDQLRPARRERPARARRVRAPRFVVRVLAASDRARGLTATTVNLTLGALGD